MLSPSLTLIRDYRYNTGMNIENSCAFCSIDQEQESERIIQINDIFASFVSNPSFRDGQCLVVPRRHVTQIHELNPDEAATIMGEIGRIGMLLDQGFGTGVMQKHQPTQPENGIKVSHLHFHVFPRQEEEPGLFPVPEPNTFDGFSHLPTEEVARTAASLRP